MVFTDESTIKKDFPDFLISIESLFFDAFRRSWRPISVLLFYLALPGWRKCAIDTHDAKMPPENRPCTGDAVIAYRKKPAFRAFSLPYAFPWRLAMAPNDMTKSRRDFSAFFSVKA